MTKALNHQMSQATLTLAALGVVFGDIGTSPLYAVREAFHGPHAMPMSPENILGVLSLIVWALIIVISIKYLTFVLRADNNGEGGVLALTSLAVPHSPTTISQWKKFLLYMGLFGSALLFGDGVITPAISVLSAIEGLETITPLFSPYVVPITVGILVLLFLTQHHGTAWIGSIFGPIILLWFSTLGALGINGILKNPIVLKALSPLYAFNFFMLNGVSGFVVLGAVFLVVTGGEALYADMGHFGKKPIQRGWFLAALPGLLLNYFGQGALLLSSPSASSNPFYKLAPTWFLIPLVIIATMATVIASQALISGVYSLAQQAVQLGYAPRMRIIHTSSVEVGQIYIPFINWTLLFFTCWLVISFKSSSSLASAYGIAVSTTMVVTTVLTCSVAYMLWKWKISSIIFIGGILLSVDIVFLTANFSKIADGGWVPLTMGAVVFLLMTTWKKGRALLSLRIKEKSIPLQDFLHQIEEQPPASIPGTAVFMTGESTGTPLALLHNVRHNKCLHQNVLLLTVLTKKVPHIEFESRVEISVIRENFYRIIANYGFMETPNINDIFKACEIMGLNILLKEVTFFLGRETILPSVAKGMSLWREHLFAFMSRNAERATAYYNIPPNQVIEVGIQIEI